MQGMSIESGFLAGGLCSVAGMLPDLDSDSGIPLRETSMFCAAIVPILMIDRFRDFGLSHEAMALAAMLIYIGIRFILVEIFKRFTVHRGMWHSLPAAASAGLLAYLVMPCPSEAIRVYKSIAVVVGFLVHLILDEIWSLDFRGGRFRLKSSFGTALKFFGKDPVGNISVYGKLFLLLYLAWGDTGILERLRERAKLDRANRPSILDPIQIELPRHERYPLESQESNPYDSQPYQEVPHQSVPYAVESLEAGVSEESISWDKWIPWR